MNQKKIALVVDDEPMVRFVSASMMENLDLEVLEADCGQKALEVLGQRPDVALLLTDVRMPGMSGPELARAALALYPHLKIILISGFVTTVEGSSWPLILKPYKVDDFKRVVLRELGV